MLGIGAGQRFFGRRAQQYGAEPCRLPQAVACAGKGFLRPLARGVARAELQADEAATAFRRAGQQGLGLRGGLIRRRQQEAAAYRFPGGGVVAEPLHGGSGGHAEHVLHIERGHCSA